MSYDHKITDLIFSEKNYVPESLCKKLVDIYDNNVDLHTFEDSYKQEDKKPMIDNYKAFNLIRHFDRPNFKEISLEIFGYIDSFLEKYKNYIIDKKICTNFDLLHINDTNQMRLIKYNEGEFIKDHTDQNAEIRGSVSINLNDNYEGGSFRFFGGQYFKDLELGEIMFFPAEPIWVHGTTPITKGCRYTCNTFLKSNPAVVKPRHEEAL
tara:strand:+ start:57 stop:683 length:627 start_codon:yes stop_codon:yes gene_type:complete